MKYDFPIIETIDDVLPHIEDFEEINPIYKDDYSVITYVISSDGLFDINPENPLPGTIRRECRGLVFDKDGRIISRPFHKFFNIGEREETLPQNINLNENHIIIEKLDGSMIRPIMTGGKIRLATKAGVTDTSILAEDIVTKEQLAWMKDRFNAGQTPIFEFISPKKRIIIEYDDEDLVFLALRDNISGSYFSMEDALELGVDKFFSIAPTYGSVDGSINEYIKNQRIREGREGDIIVIDNSARYKIKNDWYTHIHYVKSKIGNFRHVLTMILDSKIDDVYPHLDGVEYDLVKTYEKDFHQSYKNKLTFLKEECQKAVQDSGGDRKKLVMDILPKTSLSKSEWAFAFQYFDGSDMDEALMRYIRKHIMSNNKYKELAQFLDLPISPAHSLVSKKSQEENPTFK